MGLGLCFHILHARVHSVIHVCGHTHRPWSFLGSLWQVCRTCVSRVRKASSSPLSMVPAPRGSLRKQSHEVHGRVTLAKPVGNNLRLGRILSPRGLRGGRHGGAKALPVLLLACPEYPRQVPGSPLRQKGAHRGA